MDSEKENDAAWVAYRKSLAELTHDQLCKAVTEHKAQAMILRQIVKDLWSQMFSGSMPLADYGHILVTLGLAAAGADAEKEPEKPSLELDLTRLRSN